MTKRTTKRKGKPSTKGLTFKVLVAGGGSKAQTRTANVAAGGATVGEILKEAGVDTTNKNITVNGTPADLAQRLGADDIVEGQAHTIKVTERPASS
jgi:hypothetical protein